MKKALATRADIENLVQQFYERVFKDDLIAYIFTEKVSIDWEIHLPRICDFWESVLFGTGIYKGNPILKHIELHQIEALTLPHFDRWLALWEASVVAHFEGAKAEEAILKAHNMKAIMLYKIEQSSSSNFIQ